MLWEEGDGLSTEGMVGEGDGLSTDDMFKEGDLLCMEDVDRSMACGVSGLPPTSPSMDIFR